MKAIVQDRYGEADVLEFRDVEDPEVGEHDVLIRVRAAGAGPDVWHIMAGKPFMALGAYAPSDDGRLLAYSTDDTGFREYRLHVKDLATGELGTVAGPDGPDGGQERMAATARTQVWAPDGEVVYTLYSTQSATGILYVQLFLVLAGELLAKYLRVAAGLPL